MENKSNIEKEISTLKARYFLIGFMIVIFFVPVLTFLLLFLKYINEAPQFFFVFICFGISYILVVIYLCDILKNTIKRHKKLICRKEGEPDIAEFIEAYDDKEVKYKNYSFFLELIAFKALNVRKCYIAYKLRENKDKIEYEPVSKETYQILSEQEIKLIPVKRHKKSVSFDEESFLKTNKLD